MKRFPIYNGLMLFALGCVFTAQGTVLSSGVSEGLKQNDGQPASYNVSVAAGQDQDGSGSANLTLSGENSRVSIEKEGTVKLVAGKSIVLHPGTKITNGSFLFAAIEPAQKSGKHARKIVKIVTIEEKRKIDEQVSLSVAYTLFKPFPTPGKGMLRKGDGEHGNIDPSGIVLTAVTPEQQRKVAADIYYAENISHSQARLVYSAPAVPSGYRPEPMRVLRL